MLEIISGGGSSVKISTKSGTLWVDPSSRRTADKSADVKDVVQLATESHLLVDQVGEHPRLEGPGEYEAGPFAISGFSVGSFTGVGEATGYRLDVQGVTVGILGNGIIDLTEDHLELLGVVDVLVLPVVDGVAGPSPHQAAQLVRRIEPKVVMPVGVAVADTTEEPSSAALADFVKEIGADSEASGRIKIKSLGDIPEALTVILPE